MYIKKGKTMRKLFNMVALVMMTGFVFAQGSVSGTVTDSEGNALYGANVTVEGTSSGAATATDGSYSVDGVATWISFPKKCRRTSSPCGSYYRT